jgi:hypothetical protein
VCVKCCYFCTLYSRVGRFLTKIWFWMKVPLEYIPFYEKVLKIAKKKFFGQVTSWGKVILYGVKHYIRVQNFFSHNMGFMGIKKRRI